MSVAEIVTNAAAVDAQLQALIKKEIPFATSVAMQKTVLKALDEAEKAFEAFVAKNDEGSPSDALTPNLAKKGPGKGAIRARWPSKADVKRGFQSKDGRVKNAAVFIVHKDAGSGRFDLIDEVHPLVFGGTVKAIPNKNKGGVITPTTALLKGLSGKGRLKALNKFGNFKGSQSAYKALMKHAKTNKQLFLNVPLNNNDKRLAHLPPGLYFKGREKSKGGLLKVGWRYADGKLSRSSGVNPSRLVQSRAGVSKRGRAKRQQGRIVNYLVMLLAYHETRDYDGGFKFPQVVLKSYQQNFQGTFSRELRKAVDSSRARAKAKAQSQ